MTLNKFEIRIAKFEVKGAPTLELLFISILSESDGQVKDPRLSSSNVLRCQRKTLKQLISLWMD